MDVVSCAKCTMSASVSVLGPIKNRVRSTSSDTVDVCALYPSLSKERRLSMNSKVEESISSSKRCLGFGGCCGCCGGSCVGGGAGFSTTGADFSVVEADLSVVEADFFTAGSDLSWIGVEFPVATEGLTKRGRDREGLDVMVTLNWSLIVTKHVWRYIHNKSTTRLQLPCSDANKRTNVWSSVGTCSTR